MKVKLILFLAFILAPSVLGWSMEYDDKLRLPKESARPVCDEFKIKDSNTTINLSVYNITIPYNIYLDKNISAEKSVSFCIIPPRSSRYEDSFSFEIKGVDEFGFNDTLHFSGKISYFGNIYRWNSLKTSRLSHDYDDFSYPVAIPSAILAFIAFIISIAVLRKFPVTAVVVGLIGGALIFSIGILIF